MPPLFMDVKSSSSGFTSGEELDSSTSGLHQGNAVGPMPRRKVTGKGQRKDKNRDAARKSRRKQMEKADELHNEHQRLEQSNTALEKEIAALRTEVRRYAAVLECHELVCPLLAPGCSEASMLSLASTSTSTSSVITAATTLRESSPRPFATPCSPPDSNPSYTSNVASPSRPRVSDVAPMVVTSCSHWGWASLRPPHPTFAAPSHCNSTSGPGGLATSVTHPFALSTPVLTTSSFLDPPQLCPSLSSSPIHLFDNHPLPPLPSSRGRPASFTPLHPAPASDLPSRSDRGSLKTLAANAPGTVLPHHSQGVLSANDCYPGHPIHGSMGSSSVHAYQNGSTGSVFTTTSSGPGPYYRSCIPGTLLPPLVTLDHIDVGLLDGVISMGTPGSTTFSEPLPPLCDLSSDISLSQLLQTDDWFQDC